MQILFDQGTPAPLRSAFAGHDVATVHELGWSSISNGELLSQAENRYDLFVTTDQNLRYQQNLAGRQLAILVLPTTSWPALRPHAADIATIGTTMTAGQYLEYTLPS